MLHFRIIEDMSISGEALASLIEELPQWRRKEAEAFKHEQGRRENALSYRLLCDMLSEFCGITEQPVFKYTKHGKPYLRDYPDIFFNISHCKRAIACVISDRECGIDAECLGRYKAPLAEYSMSADELQRISEAEDADKIFTSLWTQKEALLKLTGEGITDDLKTVLTSSRMDGVTMKDLTNADKAYAVSMAYYGG